MSDVTVIRNTYKVDAFNDGSNWTWNQVNQWPITWFELLDENGQKHADVSVNRDMTTFHWSVVSNITTPGCGDCVTLKGAMDRCQGTINEWRKTKKEKPAVATNKYVQGYRQVTMANGQSLTWKRVEQRGFVWFELFDDESGKQLAGIDINEVDHETKVCRWTARRKPGQTQYGACTTLSDSMEQCEKTIGDWIMAEAKKSEPMEEDDDDISDVELVGLLDRVRDDVELLKRGVRSAAHRTVRLDKELAAVLEFLDSVGAEYVVTIGTLYRGEYQPNNTFLNGRHDSIQNYLERHYTHAEVTVYLREHLRYVIEALTNIDIVGGTLGEIALKDWAYGRLFGYSEEVIAKFVEEKADD